MGCRFYLLPVKISCTVSTVNELTWCCRRDTCRTENWTLLSKYLLHCLHCTSQGFPNRCVFLQPLSWMKFKKNKKNFCCPLLYVFDQGQSSALTFIDWTAERPHWRQWSKWHKREVYLKLTTLVNSRKIIFPPSLLAVLWFWWRSNGPKIFFTST